MIDINLIRTNPELVKENIRKKFQDHKLPLVDKALELDGKRRNLIAEGDALRAARNTLSKQVGMLMKEGKREEAEAVKAQVKADADRLLALEQENAEVEAELKKVMMTIPNIIDPSVPIGKNDEDNRNNRERAETNDTLISAVNMDYRSFIMHFECGVWICDNQSVYDIKEH